MYIPIGADMAVRAEAVVGVFDLDNASWSRHTRAWLRRAEREGEVFAISEDVPRSAILTEEFGMRRIYLTPLSTAAFERRAKRGIKP